MTEGYRKFVSAEQEARVKAPIESAATLPNEAFTSQGFYDLEVDNIYSKKWVAVAFEHQISNAGDLLPVSLCGKPILLLRNASGDVRAFHNVCPYDGCLAVIDPIPGATEIVAPYHGWRYDLDGALKAIPYWDGSVKGDLSSLGDHKSDLAPIRCETWCGVILVNLSDEGQSFEHYIAPAEAMLKGTSFKGLDYALSGDGKPIMVTSDVATNWKTFFENACINVLHESFVHELYAKSPEVPRVGDNKQKKFREVIEGDLLAFEFREEDVQETYREMSGLPHIGIDPDKMPDRGYFGTLYPNLYFAVQPAFIEIGLTLPDGPTRSLDYRGYLVNPKLANGPEHAELRNSISSEFGQAAAEDNRITEAVQKARYSPVCDQKFYAPFWDQLHYRLNQLVLDDVSGARNV